MRFSSSFILSSLAALVALVALGCVEQKPGIEGTTSLRVVLVSPADPGSFEDRLLFDERDATIWVEALDAQGELDTSVTGTLDVYTHYLGSLTPELGQAPLTTIQIANGVTAETMIQLPVSYGATFLWVEHFSGDNPTFATGTSPTLWYRNPFLEDVSRPLDEMALDAFEASPLEQKEIEIDSSRYGANGRMIVTGVYAQGYTLSDVNCTDANGTPPCTTDSYDSVFVFSFSRAEDTAGRDIERGQIIDKLTGAVSEFNGLTEVNFPESFVSDTTAHDNMLPAPIVIQSGWLTTRIEMERAEAALVSIVNAEVCPIDEDFETYAQWKLDLGLGCGTPVNVISKGVAADFNPVDHVGEFFPEVVGTLRPVNIGSFHVWIIYPRDGDDITPP